MSRLGARDDLSWQIRLKRRSARHYLEKTRLVLGWAWLDKFEQ